VGVEADPFEVGAGENGAVITVEDIRQTHRAIPDASCAARPDEGPGPSGARPAHR